MHTFSDSRPPQVYKEQPFQRCSWDNLSLSLDPGDFNFCLRSKWVEDMRTGDDMDWVHLGWKCKGLTPSILAQPSKSLWFNMQLVVFADFFLLCVWLIALEAEEKHYVSVALSLRAIYRERPKRYGRQWWERTVLAPTLLLVLSGLYAACLWCDEVEERFLVTGSTVIFNALLKHLPNDQVGS